MLACGTNDNTVFIYKHDGVELTLHSKFTKHLSGIKAIYWETDTQILTGGGLDCGKVYSWDVNRPNRYSLVAVCEGQVTGVARRPDESIIISLGHCWDKESRTGLLVWKTGKIVAKYEFSGLLGSVGVTGMSVNELFIVAACKGGNVRLFRLPKTSVAFEENKYIKIR